MSTGKKYWERLQKGSVEFQGRAWLSNGLDSSHGDEGELK